MSYIKRPKIFTSVFLTTICVIIAGYCPAKENEFVSLFNGKDLTGWIIPQGDGGHWKVSDRVIDYDAKSEASDDKNLWTENDYSDFILRIDWRIKDSPFVSDNVRMVRPDGTFQRGIDGKIIRMTMPCSDSGIYLRGMIKAQINIWCWPVGSGEIWGYRTDSEMPPEVIQSVTPLTLADHHVGEWNTFEITMIGEYVTVRLNDIIVIDNARLPGVHKQGPVGLQHHGRWEDGKYVSPPSLVQFRNIYIKEL